MFNQNDNIDLWQLLIAVLGDISKDTAVKIAGYGIQNFAGLSIQELHEEFPEIGHDGATRLNASIRLGLKLIRETKPHLPVINNPEDAFHLLEEMRYLDQEYFVVLLLDDDNRLICKETIAQGEANCVNTARSDLFKHALRRNARKIILVHNHRRKNMLTHDFSSDILGVA